VLQYLLFWDVVWHWLAVGNIPEEPKTSSTTQQKPKILQRLFFSAASVMYHSTLEVYFHLSMFCCGHHFSYKIPLMLFCQMEKYK
jgi:hypothetical protein